MPIFAYDIPCSSPLHSASVSKTITTDASAVGNFDGGFCGAAILSFSPACRSHRVAVSAVGQELASIAIDQIRQDLMNNDIWEEGRGKLKTQSDCYWPTNATATVTTPVRQQPGPSITW